ncbi:site-specific integrase [Kriegella aquimaris]|uniref:Site-specific recombinase XerD n=1 Tax=Kriegella aquimaris TaxID=192904 RepID=A0A1G9XUL9_9FLAO|nr:site-specific integrase [Kriegella aquimaris]SDM99865.1 Site-specific recombinase XerD [Kriegella aquimaris]
MSSIKTVLRKKALADGTYPVCLRVTKNRKTKFFNTIFKTTENEWDFSSGCFNRKNSNYIQNNRLLLKFKDRALKIYSDLQLEKEYFDLDDFSKRFRVDNNPASGYLFPFWEEIIAEMRLAGRMGNATMYNETMKSVNHFCRFKKIRFQDITNSFLNKYEAWLRSRGGTDGGISIKQRTLRALYNKAIERDITKDINHPFKTYKISKLKGRGIKKALDMDQVSRIIQFDLIKYPHLRDARNYFVFSFYTRGMNYTDMMVLEWKDIDATTISYIRNKTKGRFVITILPPVREILNYYKENALATEYVFPILLKDGLTPAQIADRKKKTLAKYNRDLKEIAKICAINKSLSSYVARHSFANCLKQKGVATDIIGESLGHKDLMTTQVYLKELGSTVLDDAAALLL